MVPRAVFVDGLRTPFQLPHTGYSNMTGASLLSVAINSLLSRHPTVHNQDIDHVVAGNVFHEPQSPNVAGSAARKAGVFAPAHSISMACISGQAALGKGIAMINSGNADLVLAGGVEYLTDIPVRVNKKLRELLLKAQRTENTREKVALLLQFRPAYLQPDVLNVVEYQTKETFVFNGDKIAKRFEITREDQDTYGYRSHVLSNEAFTSGKFQSFMCSVDNTVTIKSDSTLRHWDEHKLRNLRTVLRNGTVTRATANQPCDGAAVSLLASEAAVEKFNLVPRAYLSPVAFAGCSPVHSLLMGTTHAIAKLKISGLNIENVDVFELYEGFAGEVLSQLAALRCPGYAKSVLQVSSSIADIDVEKVNKWGGTIGLGHAFGATGIRLLLHAVGRLEEEGAELGLIAGCAGGGLGAAFSVKRVL